MYINSAYLNNSLVDFKDKSKPLVVGSCGTYHLYTRPKLPTYRPRGRVDFQLLYIASGIAHFYFDNNEKDTVVPAGHMVLYRPREPQRYVYYGNEQTEVYWVHFTGGSVKKILAGYGITNEMRVLPTGTSLDYARIFKQMIHELQRCQTHYPEVLTLLLQQLLQIIILRRSHSLWGMTTPCTSAGFFGSRRGCRLRTTEGLDRPGGIKHFYLFKASS